MPKTCIVFLLSVIKNEEENQFGFAFYFCFPLLSLVMRHITWIQLNMFCYAARGLFVLFVLPGQNCSTIGGGVVKYHWNK